MKQENRVAICVFVLKNFLYTCIRINIIDDLIDEYEMQGKRGRLRGWDKRKPGKI